MPLPPNGSFIGSSIFTNTSGSVKTGPAYVGTVYFSGGTAQYRLRDGGATGTVKAVINSSVGGGGFFVGISFETDLYVEVVSYTSGSLVLFFE